MSARKLLRIVLAVVILVLLWVRIARQWRYESHWWLVGSIVLSILLLLLVLAIIRSSFLHKRPNPRDEVPKRPLGLE